MSAFSREFFTFIEVAREKSIRRAAEKLNLSASALSRQMQILEQAFGTPLFVRLPQGLKLTEQGEALLAQAQRWLDDETALRAAMGNRGQAGGSLRLGIMECLTPFLAQNMSPDQTALTIRVGSTETLVDQLRRNQIEEMVAGIRTSC